MKKIFLFLLILTVFAAYSALAQPQSRVLTPSNWQDVFQKLDPSYLAVHQKRPLDLVMSLGVSGTMQSTIYFVFANGTVRVTPSGAQSPNVTLSRGIYIIAGYYDGARFYAYIYTITGWVATLNLGSSTGVAFDKRVYARPLWSGSHGLVFATVQKILYDWQGRAGGGATAWLLFNVTGNVPVSYDVREGTGTITMAYGGGPPIYMLYVGAYLPLNVTGTGLRQLFGAGAYLIEGANWFYANFTPAEQPSQNQTSANTATLTVTVSPSTFRIQFLSGGALVKEGNGTLTYAFPKNSTVTVRIVDNVGREKYKFDVKMDRDKYYSLNFGTDSTIYDPTKTYTLTLYFFEMSPTGAYRGQIVVDSVQVIGVNASVRARAEGVSNVRFTNLPAGHYQIIVQKEGYFETRAWINLDTDRTLYIGLFKKADTGGTDRPYSGGYVAPSNTTQPFDAISDARSETPPAPSVSGNFYGLRFVLIDPSTGQRKSGTVTVSAVKRVGKVLWEDTVTVPLVVLHVNGTAWWYITEHDLLKAIQISGFWESFGGFKITSGSNTMFVPAEMAKNRFYEVVIYHGQAIFGTAHATYSSGLFDGGGTLAQLMPILIVLAIIGMIGQVLKRR